MPRDYVHGYTESEAVRLNEQARTLADLLHHDTRFPEDSRVLEVGCGTGAQTEILACRSPRAQITAVDMSAASLREADKRIRAKAIGNVRFEQADCRRLPHAENHFDHAFVCFLLEHLANPDAVLKELRRVLKPGGTMTVIEGDHGSFYCYPETEAARQTVRCLIDLQAETGGNALIGRRLYPLLKQAGFEDVRVSPRVVYADPSRPEWEQGFSRDTFIAMVEGVGPMAVQRKMMTLSAWQRGIDDLKATIGRGTFHYTFFKAVARKAN